MFRVSIIVSAPCPDLEALVKTLADKGYPTPGAPHQCFNVVGVEISSEEEVLEVLALVEGVAAAHPETTFAPMAAALLDSHEYSCAE